MFDQSQSPRQESIIKVICNKGAKIHFTVSLVVNSCAFQNRCSFTLRLPFLFKDSCGHGGAKVVGNFLCNKRGKNR